MDVRGKTLTERNIRSGWKRAGIWPPNKQRILDDPEVQNFGRTTPEYQPAPVNDGLLTTPKRREEFRQLTARIEAKVTPRTRRAVRKLGHGAIQEYTGAQLLQRELRQLRQQATSQEIQKRSKRLRNEAVQRSWDLEQVKAAREGRPPSRVSITRRTANSLICVFYIKS